MGWEYNPYAKNNKEVLNIQSKIEAITNEIAYLQVSLNDKNLQGSII